MKIIAETKRLILREITLNDKQGMFELDSDPDVHKYLGNNPVKDLEQTIEVIHFIRQQYTDNGIGRWAIIDKKTNDFIGWTGLKYVTQETNGHKNYYDLGYRLKKKYWGKGIAKESAIASLEYAFNSLNTTEVYAMADCMNKGSNKILQDIGLTLVQNFLLDKIQYNWYKITKTQYQEQQENL
ncbi:GNAT family N-acetyltransferase [Myroides sp. LJL116]